MVSAKDFFYLFDIDFSLPPNHDFEKWKHLFDILFFTDLQKI